jgi:hypothetical protein
MTIQLLKKHVQILKKAARANKGVLPSYTALERAGLFRSYDVVRAAGLLYRFKRAMRPLARKRQRGKA